MEISCKIKCILSLLLLIIFSVSPVNYFKQYVFAADNFITDYNIVYTVNENGITSSVMKVQLSNTANDYYYATSYKLQLGFDHIANITASDKAGIITPLISKTKDGYLLQIDFNSKVIGTSNKQEFTLNFDTPDIAVKQGKVWEINIPGIEDNKNIGNFNVDIKVPDSFGKPTYIKPCVNTAQDGIKTNINQPYDCGSKLQFNKEQLSKSGISLAFGKEQIYGFTLLYHLQNKNLFPIRTEIALPPDTNYQNININKISPEPVQVHMDQDGNWLAEYDLMPAQSKDIKVNGEVKISLLPQKVYLSEKEQEIYLQEQPYWQISSGKIKSIAKTLKTPKEIYDYVVTNLKYDFSRITTSDTRLGSVKVLENKDSAVCLEFTDLFIALARAAGIPAREVDGYAFTKNTKQRPISLIEDILHSWPEYYDQKLQKWIMVDPTWGNTTGGVDYFNLLDFDHFAFVKKGASSTYPIPAGGYKLSNDGNKKDVYIWSVDKINVKNFLSLQPVLPEVYTAGLPFQGKVIVKNLGSKKSSVQTLNITSQGLLKNPIKFEVNPLLPYEQKQYYFNLNNTNVLTNNSYQIKIDMADNHAVENIQIKPFFLEKWKFIGGIISVILALGIFIITLRSGSIHIHR